MGRITVSSHIMFYETMEKLEKNTCFKDPENHLMLDILLKWASRERGAWTNCTIFDPFRFIILNGLVFTSLQLSRLERKIEALEAEARESGIELKAPGTFEQIPQEPDLISSTQENYVLQSLRQTGLDENIFQSRS